MLKRKLVKTLLPVAAVSSLILSGTGFSSKEEADASGLKKEQVKNVIFLIGDGMGESYTAAHRYIKDNPKTKGLDRTIFDQYKVGSQMTFPDDDSQNITDSASAATAMAGAVKTYNAAIAVDNDKSEVKTVLEVAKERGKAAGLIATSEITHATPAAFGAHDENRNNMSAIADDYYDELIKGKHKVDVLLGGGSSYFIRKDRNLVNSFQKDGYDYVTNKQELLKSKGNQVLGLFASGGMDKMIDRDSSTPSLEEMTKTAITKLNKDKDGFFLMVEGSQIDWAGHDNDIVAAMSEMEDFEKAYKAAIDFAKKDKHTLVVATADHSTGGFSVGSGGIYNWNPAPIKAAKRTPDFMASLIDKGEDVQSVLKKYMDLELTAAEIQSVKDAAKNKKTDQAIEKIFDTRSGTGWTTGGHTGEDVPVYAYGPQKEKFAGLLNNTDHAKIIFGLWGAASELHRDK